MASLLCASEEVSSREGEDVFSILNEQEEVMVSASRYEQKRGELPVSTEIITGDELRRSGVVFLPEILRRYAGVDVQQTTAGDFKVSIRGMYGRVYEPDKVLLMIDGRPLVLDAFGEVNWNQVPMAIEDIERVEIVRGPATASYGGNAVLGVVNLISKRTENRPTVAGSLVPALIGGARSVPLQPGLRFTARTASISESGRHRFNATLTDYYTVELPPPSLSFFALTGSSTATYSYVPSEAHELRFSLYTQGSGRKFIRSTDNPAPFVTGLIDLFVSGEYEAHHLGAGDGNLLVRLSYRPQGTSTTFFGPYGNLPLGFTHSGIGESVYSRSFGPNNHLTVGGDVRFSVTDWAIFQNAGRTGLSGSLFIQDDWRVIDPLLLTVALRGSVQAYLNSAVRPFPLLGPKAGLSYRLAKGHTLRTSASYGMRAPSQLDLFARESPGFALFGSPNLVPEGVFMVDLGYALSLSSLFEASASVFYSSADHIRDVIDTAPVTQGNVHTVNGVGAEVSATLRPLQGIKLQANYTYQYYAERSTGTPFANGPPHKANLQLDVETVANVSVNFAAGYIDRTPFSARVAPDIGVPALTSVGPRFYTDVSLAWRSDSGLRLQLACTNANRLVAPMREYPAPGTNQIGGRVMVTLGYDGPLAKPGPAVVWQDKWWATVATVALGATVLGALAAISDR